MSQRSGFRGDGISGSLIMPTLEFCSFTQLSSLNFIPISISKAACFHIKEATLSSNFHIGISMLCATYVVLFIYFSFIYFAQTATAAISYIYIYK